MCKRLLEHSSEDFDNVDTPIYYVRKFNEYGLKIFDGGSSFIVLEFCPWCGEKLSESKRNQWFEEVEKLGIDPWTEDIPEKYQTDEWYKS